MNPGLFRGTGGILMYLVPGPHSCRNRSMGSFLVRIDLSSFVDDLFYNLAACEAGPLHVALHFYVSLRRSGQAGEERKFEKNEQSEIIQSKAKHHVSYSHSPSKIN